MGLDRKIQDIERLLDLYYDGLSNSEQEKQLRNFFASEDVPAHLEHEKEMFDFYTEESNNNFEAEIEVLTEKTKVVKLTWLRYAAAAVLFVGLGWLSNIQYNDYVKQQEVKLAYQQTQEAMQILSSNFNVGVKKAGTLAMMNKTQQEIINKKYTKK